MLHIYIYIYIYDISRLRVNVFCVLCEHRTDTAVDVTWCCGSWYIRTRVLRVCAVDINDVNYAVLQRKAQFEMELLVQLKYIVLSCVSAEGHTWSRDLFVLYRVVRGRCEMNRESCGGLP